MKIYCLDDFKIQFEKLKRKNSYKSLEKDILDYFFADGKIIQSFLEGTRLNGSSTDPYIKKRVKGSGGWRFYFLVIIKNDALYLMFVHPKTGPDGSDNIEDDFKSAIYKKVLSCIKSKDLYELKKDEKATKLIFKHLSDKKSIQTPIAFKTVNKSQN